MIVQRMVPPGVDVRISCVTDELLGPILTVGLGSMQVKLPGEVSRMVPLSEAGASALVESSHVGPALAAAGIDRAPLVEVIRRVSQLAADHHEIDQIQIDPALVSPAGCYPTDVRVVLNAVERPDRALRRLS